MVGALFVTDTVHSAVAVYAAWELCVANYNNPSSLAVVGWTIPFTAVATSVAAIITQFFLAYRVYILTKNAPVVGVIGLLSFLGFIFGVYAGVRSGIINEVKNFAPLTPFVICWLGFQTCADLLITFVLSFALARSRTGFRKTDTIINRLIRGAIQTGFFVSLFALADLFSFVLHRNTNFYAFFAYPIGRIYTNTLLDTLNSRNELKLMVGTHVSENTGPTATFLAQNHGQSETFAGIQTSHVEITKEVLTHVSTDAKFGDDGYPAATSAV
jgi:hypothetical protein